MAATLRHLHDVPEALAWLASMGVHHLTVDSREVAARVAAGEALAFVAWPGAAKDGRAYVRDALRDGAKACLVEQSGVEAHAFADERVATLPNLKALLAVIAHEFHGRPSEALAVLAVTGTNGKTTTSWWTAQALSALGQPCGVIGTLGVGRPGSGDFVSTGLTTPDPVTLHATFKQFVDVGLTAAAIEASSIGIQERRLDAARIQVAQFTNFTQDHLDYHGSMAAYWQAKRALFDWPGLQSAVINLDDPKGPELVAHARERGLKVWSYSQQQPARLHVLLSQPSVEGMDVVVSEQAEDGQQVLGQARIQAPIIGDFNVANVLAVLGGLRALGVPLREAARACRRLTAVPGRMQSVRSPRQDAMAEPLVVVDYAHTPDALHKALQALRPVTQARGGRLWCVFGCGGNRDAIKRPLMGAMADQQADEVVITSDNPRDESPALILSQILTGVARTQVAVIENRHEAILHALRSADQRDVVLIAGKGHEQTQEVAGVKTPFSDIDEAMNALSARRAA
jgi:UDP-N-acetylmuramyl-tripeptide synthetase